MSDRFAAARARLCASFEQRSACRTAIRGEGSARVVRNIQARHALFWIWLSSLRDQLPALFGILFLLPTGILMDRRMAAILVVLALAYTISNVIVIRRTSRGQRSVERYTNDVSSRLSDVIGNVTIVQSFTRLGAEITAMRDLLTALLFARYPVLTWWGVLAVLQRSAATLTMVAVLALGTILAERGELSVGEIVSFTAFASLLIGKLDQLSGFVVRTQDNLAPVASLLDCSRRAWLADRSDARPLEP